MQCRSVEGAEARARGTALGTGLGGPKSPRPVLTGGGSLQRDLPFGAPLPHSVSQCAPVSPGGRSQPPEGKLGSWTQGGRFRFRPRHCCVIPGLGAGSGVNLQAGLRGQKPDELERGLSSR